MSRARLNATPSISIAEQAKYVDAGYGVRGVDFVQAQPELTVLAFEIAIEGSVTRELVEKIVAAAIAAAED